jgi:hypothetical protein
VSVSCGKLQLKLLVNVVHDDLIWITNTEKGMRMDWRKKTQQKKKSLTGIHRELEEENPGKRI